MLLKELQLYNFRQYIGSQKVIFSTDSDKNVTLLLGKNTSGKTTFVQAFRWILYNNSDFVGSGKNSTRLLNDKVRRSMSQGQTETVKASIILEHQGKLYQITRSLDYRSHISGDAEPEKSSRFSILSNENGEFVPTAIDVDTILPRDLSEYFFFDGEKIATSTNKTNVEQSINTIMGLVPLKLMIEHLNPNTTSSVYAKLDDRRQEDPSGKITPLKNELNRAKASLESCNDRKGKESINNENLKQAWIEAHDKFAKIEEIASMQEKLTTTEEDITRTEQGHKVAEEKLISAYPQVIMEHYTRYISSKLLEQLKNISVIDKGIPDITANTITYLLNRNKCACGCDLVTNSAAREELLALLSYVPPESIGTQITHLKKDLEYYANSSDQLNVFSARSNDYDGITRRLVELRCQKDGLLHTIGETGTDAKKIKDYYIQTEKDLKTSNEQLQKLGSQVISWNKEVTRLTKEIGEISKVSGINDDLDKELMYVRALHHKACIDYETGSKDILTKMRETLQSVFASMYHGKRTISLSDDYKITLSAEGSVLDASKGLETVKNFAFITTLLKVARDRMDDTSGLTAEPYPLVMDAVFSNTDEQHIRNICHELPAMAEQSVLAIMEKDWNIAKKTLAPNVGKVYRINKISEYETQIKEVAIDES